MTVVLLLQHKGSINQFFDIPTQIFVEKCARRSILTVAMRVNEKLSMR
jgi:hypothetical protein